jgi:ABC-type nickel/cobalt efflux system permease component RcnA
MVLGAKLLLAGMLAVHPLGNFTSNSYAGIVVGRDQVAVDYVLDLAEIPTQQVSDFMGPSFAEDRCGELAGGLRLEVDRERVELTSTAAVLTQPPGLAGLPTLRLECSLLAATGPLRDGASVSFVDGNLDDAIGWREVTATGDGMGIVDSDVPAESVSARLTAYPAGRRALDTTSAAFSVATGGTRAGPVASPPLTESVSRTPGSGDRQTRWLASLVDDRRLTWGAGTLAFLAALVLGTLHALAPGHGKTIMAAYIVGRKGRLRHVLAIGATVAATHTIGVLGLGLLLSTSEAFAGERVYPILGAASGALVVVVGVTLLARMLRGAGNHHQHGHEHGHGRGHWRGHGHGRGRGRGHEHGHGRGHDHHHHDRHGHHHHDEAMPGWGGLVAMGVAGGLVPSPSAVLVLLGALALGRAWFGLLLVLAYGAGMALTLLGAGLALNRLRGWIEPRLARFSSRRLPRLLPLGSALAVIGGGIVLTLRAVVAV